MLITIQKYLQGFMDAFWSGTVNVWVCDGIPGNCTVSFLDTKVLEVSTSLQGRMQVRSRARFSLLYLDTNPDGGWLQMLEDWCHKQSSLGETPGDMRIWVERTGCKQNTDGTFAITGCLTTEYETIYEEIE